MLKDSFIKKGFFLAEDHTSVAVEAIAPQDSLALPAASMKHSLFKYWHHRAVDVTMEIQFIVHNILLGSAI